MIARAEALDGLARSSGGSAVMSVGFAPGLTNLMVRSAAVRLDHAEAARIGVLLGPGDAHGEAAILWTLRNAGAPDMRGARPVRLRFGDDRGARLAYPFLFSDQDAVRRTLGLLEATTSCPWAASFSPGSRSVALPLLRDRPGAQRAMAALLARLRVGPDRAALAVEVSGRRDGRPASVAMTCEDRGEAAITAQVAAFVIRRLLETEAPPGVHHIDEAVDAEAVFADLAIRGVAVTVR